MTTELLIYGAGDFGREIMYAAKENKDEIFEMIAFVDDDGGKIGNRIEGVKIISCSDAVNSVNKNSHFIIGVGNPVMREIIFKKLASLAPHIKYATVIHKAAVVMPNVIIEEGVFIAPQTTVAIGSYLKRHSTINQNVSVGHDTVVGEYSVVSPGCILSGKTKIGCCSLLGSNVVTYPNIVIGDYCSVSASTVVARNLKDNKKLILRQSLMALPNEK
jgi:sugar O-acyltransferase (sialic acid O-acetyltransferase NeuD family)